MFQCLRKIGYEAFSNVGVSLLVSLLSRLMTAPFTETEYLLTVLNLCHRRGIVHVEKGHDMLPCLSGYLFLGCLVTITPI